MNYKIFYRGYFIPEDKLLELWDIDAVSVDPVEGGWMFWVLV